MKNANLKCFLCAAFLLLLPIDAFAKCKLSLNSKDWKKVRISGSKEYRCKNKTCGGDKFLLRFHDTKVRVPKNNEKLRKAISKNNGPLKFQGMRGNGHEDAHGQLYHKVETYFSPSRILGFYSQGTVGNKNAVRRNFKLLKKNLKCR